MSVRAVAPKTPLPDLARVPAVDEVGVDERVARFQTRSIKTASKVEALRLVLSMIDLTTLEGQDTPGKVRQLCQKAIHLHDAMPGLPHVAAVCVYPNMVAVAKEALAGHSINIASVATAFPSGMSSLGVRLDDTRMAVEAGANEIDMVISRGRFLAGDYRFVFDEITAVKEACADAHLKVILETGELGTLDRVRRASVLAMYAGDDFIKTSTGKIQPAATMQVTLVMLQAIRDYYYDTGRMVGMKPAGGISTAKLAIHYLVMLRETLGNAWLTPEWFRFGASSLANDVLMQLMKQSTGYYQSADYFSGNEFADIPGHVFNAIGRASLWIGIDGGGCAFASPAEEGVGVIGDEVAPWPDAMIHAARRLLPLGLGGKPETHPAREFVGERPGQIGGRQVARRVGDAVAPIAVTPDRAQACVSIVAAEPDLVLTHAGERLG
jgi:deoxyribose-phosphate aldolase